MNYEILTIIAAIFELLGIYYIAKKNRVGFILFIICSFLWVTYVIIAKSTVGLLIVCPIATYLNVKGFIYWGKE